MCYFNVFFLFVMLCTSALSFGGWLSYFLEMPGRLIGRKPGIDAYYIFSIKFLSSQRLDMLSILFGNRGFVLESVVDISEDALLGASYG